jgi:hypothetical protein
MAAFAGDEGDSLKIIRSSSSSSSSSSSAFQMKAWGQHVLLQVCACACSVHVMMAAVLVDAMALPLQCDLTSPEQIDALKQVSPKCSTAEPETLTLHQRMAGCSVHAIVHSAGDDDGEDG